MTSNPSYSQFGMEAMNNYFMTNNSMISPDAPSFHPNMPHDGSFDFGDPLGFTDIGVHFMTNNTMLTSLANQLFCAPPLQSNLDASISSGEMNGANVASDSCSTAHSLLPTSANIQFGPSDGVIVQPSKKIPKLNREPQCSWSYDGTSTVSVHDPYYLTGLATVAISYPLAAGSAATSELSLSLGSKSSSISMVNVPDQSSDVSCSGLTHVNSKGMGYQQPAKVQTASDLVQPTCHNVGVDTMLSHMYPQMYPRPMHFSQVLSQSRYVHAAQQILNEVLSHVLQDVTEFGDSVSGIDSEVRPSHASSCLTRAPYAVSSNQLMVSSDEHLPDGTDSTQWMESHKLRNELVKMIHLMDQKCNQCLDQIQNTTAKFNNLTSGGSGISAPFAQNAVSTMYRALRKRTVSEIMLLSRRPSKGEQSLSEKERSWESSFIQKHWALQQLRRGDQQSWRPQRGLPEKSVAVLKAWMFENFLRPYPKDNEKEMLAARSGLSRSQVSNWFINARVRLWKPMIEEMYEELKKTSGGSEGLTVEHLSNKDVVSSKTANKLEFRKM